MSLLTGALMLIAFISQAGSVDNTTGCDVTVTITYECSGQTFTKTFTALKAQPTSFSIPSGCCVTSALFEYGAGSSITLTGVGYQCSGSCPACGSIAIAWIDQGAGSCENSPSFGIGCGPC